MLVSKMACQPHNNLTGKDCLYSHFTDEETETHKHSDLSINTEADFRPTCTGSEAPPETMNPLPQPPPSAGEQGTHTHTHAHTLSKPLENCPFPCVNRQA